ncbi:prephenate dehydratase [Bacillus alveayuensis]|jgi:prephenate dehydratase|uniref:prephenate dehydratase n=1 Tax=Aeribacillus alveayuensis TaxID=279215 RepID=UPI0005D11E9D|nr:prephenate dehydratase [Bacillus alveayuensis]
MKVGYLGPRATFTHLAVAKFFGSNVELIPYATIPSSMDAVEKEEVYVTVVPLENALEGSVNLTLDYLIHETPLYIVGELIAPIEQHLMVHPDRKDHWGEIEKVYSHPHAIAQCHKFLHQHLPHVTYEYATSTGAAAKYISEHPSEKVAVIANELAAKEYQLHIVKRNIHDYQHNHTRFVMLHPNKDYEVKNNERLQSLGYKTTLVVTLPSNRAGSLHQVLSAFAWRKLNMSKIESRPMKTGLGNYLFIIDIDMKMDEVLIPGAIAELEALGCGVKFLGSYPSFQISS